MRTLFVAFLMIFGTIALSEASDFRSSYLEKISESTHKQFCGDHTFRTDFGFASKIECDKSLERYENTCRELVKPLIKDISKIDNKSDLVIYRNIGELYGLCVLAISYQEKK